MKGWFSPPVRICCAALLVLAALFILISAIVDGNFGYDFWLGLVLTVFFAASGYDAYYDLRNDKAARADEVSSPTE